jgi:hypothetical protein
MDVEKIKAELKALLDNDSILDETKLHARNEAIDYIKYAGEVLSIPGYAGKLEPVYQQALALQNKLTAINKGLFEQVRDDIQKGKYTPESLRTTLGLFTNYTPGKEHLSDYEYDGLDLLLEAVLFPISAPVESRKRIPGMIRYEATPARVILEMIDNLHFMPDDIFFDIGSGLGFVVMLVNLLTNMRCVGIEYDPAYCEYAQISAQSLNLRDISFIQGDARHIDLLHVHSIC